MHRDAQQGQPCACHARTALYRCTASSTADCLHTTAQTHMKCTPYCSKMQQTCSQTCHVLAPSLKVARSAERRARANRWRTRHSQHSQQDAPAHLHLVDGNQLLILNVGNQLRSIIPATALQEGLIVEGGVATNFAQLPFQSVQDLKLLIELLEL